MRTREGAASRSSEQEQWASAFTLANHVPNYCLGEQQIKGPFRQVNLPISNPVRQSAHQPEPHKEPPREVQDHHLSHLQDVVQPEEAVKLLAHTRLPATVT